MKEAMENIPLYFESVRKSSSDRWVLLEKDPELAGPWHQLFKQVQSPRHVVSELLQNADDAGATEASVKIENGDFIFTHNGEDFSEEHFKSLCRFGYSNKRALHTIGFRGIGFKSVFSLGDIVYLRTSSLNVLFKKDRFTEPIWNFSSDNVLGTEIRVPIKDHQRIKELEKNLKEWQKSPVSLLFFRSLRSLIINGQNMQWEILEAGPIQNSEWVSLSKEMDKKYLKIKSEPEFFPDDALAEIMEERMVSIEEETSFPPCTIEIVLGSEGRLFVILPTGVKTTLPFACNAPFIQDPARLKIKDPEISPTNRWLLERIGRLVANAMLSWINRVDLDVEEKCQSYALLPDVVTEENSIENACERIVAETCRNSLCEKEFILTDEDRLTGPGCCTSIPEILFDIWPNKILKKYFLSDSQNVLSRYIAEKHKRKMINWNFCTKIDKQSIVASLRLHQLPQPSTWNQLLELWQYILSEIDRYGYSILRKQLNIIPVLGKNNLFPAEKVIRLGEKKMLKSKEDWLFLADYLLVLNQNWTRYLAKKRKQAEDKAQGLLSLKVSDAFKVLRLLNLDVPSDSNKLMEKVAGSFFLKRPNVGAIVQLTQIAACLGVTISHDFKFVTRDGYVRSGREIIIHDLFKDVDLFVSGQWYEEHVLHESYDSFRSCTEDEWRQWIESGRSRIHTFIPVTQIKRGVYSKDKVLEFLKLRGDDQTPEFPYSRPDFTIQDWDFDQDVWDFWENQSKDDPEIWGRIFCRILEQKKEFWEKKTHAKVFQNGTKYRKSLTQKDLIASWLFKFRELPCLLDTHGFYRQPSEVLVRTPETEMLLDVESFVRAEDDRDETRPLLILIGVRDTPTSPDLLIDRLRAVKRIDPVRVYEVEKWCSRIDQIINRCRTDEFQKIKKIFIKERLILSSELTWTKSDEIFLFSDEDAVPGAALIHPVIKNLSIWHKIGVAERPTFELSLGWLGTLESNKKLTKDELRRVRYLLPLYAKDIWEQCRHWINLEGEWAKVDQLIYKLTMQSLIPWGKLFPHIKQKTADLQKLNSEQCSQYPFSELLTLAGEIEERISEEKEISGEFVSKPWLQEFGKRLARISGDDSAETTNLKSLGQCLSRTQWCIVDKIEATPYIDGAPAGLPRPLESLWKDEILYVKGRSLGKTAKAVANELGKSFSGRGDNIIDAIKICFERDSDFIEDYMQENFHLEPLDLFTEEKGATENNDRLPDDEVPNSGEPVKVASEESLLNSHEYDHGSESSDPAANTGSEPEEEFELRKKRRSKESPMDRFAQKLGFEKQGNENIFVHRNGCKIEKLNGSNSFPWEKHSISGDVLQYYWVKDHCIEKAPLQMNTDVWNLCMKQPALYSLILTDSNGFPVEHSGQQLLELKEKGMLEIYPASYRIVWNDK